MDELVLPETGWWDSHHAPLGARLERCRQAHADDPDALAAASRCQREIDLRQRHAGAFCYVFFVMRLG